MTMPTYKIKLSSVFRWLPGCSWYHLYSAKTKGSHQHSKKTAASTATFGIIHFLNICKGYYNKARCLLSLWFCFELWLCAVAKTATSNSAETVAADVASQVQHPAFPRLKRAKMRQVESMDEVNMPLTDPLFGELDWRHDCKLNCLNALAMAELQHYVDTFAGDHHSLSRRLYQRDGASWQTCQG